MKKTILLILLILALVPAVRAADKDTVFAVDVKNWVWDIYNDPSHTFLTDAVLNRMINLSARNYAMFNWSIDTVITSNGMKSYALNSNFVDYRGVLLLIDGREQSLGFRSDKADEAGEIGFGKDAARTTGGGDKTPAYFRIDGNGKAGYYITVDPPESKTGADTIIINYLAQVNEATGDSTIILLPYSVIPVLVWDILQSAFIRNRDQPNATDAAKYATEKFALLYGQLMNKRSDPATIPVQR